MKHSYIAPIPYLHMIPDHVDFHLILAHLCTDETYCAFYREKFNRGDTIMLDNGAFENGVPYTIEQIAGAVEKLQFQPQIIVAPDYPGRNWVDTVAATSAFINESSQYFDEFETMAVPQSEKGDYTGWINGYVELRSIAPWIGMSILGIPTAFCELTGTNDISFNRTFATQYLMNNVFISSQTKHHYLGCSDPREILMMREMGLANSNDSSTAFHHAIKGIRFDDSGRGLVNGKDKTPVDFHEHFHPAIVPLVEYNINWIENLLTKPI